LIGRKFGLWGSAISVLAVSLGGLSTHCKGQGELFPSAHASYMSAATPLNQDARLISIRVNESGKWHDFSVWRVPVVGAHQYNVAYVLVRTYVDSDSRGDVLWWRFTHDAKSGRGAPFVPQPRLEMGGAWNPVRRLFYLVEASSLQGHNEIAVYAISPEASGGTFPPLQFQGMDKSHNELPSMPKPITEFDPAQSGHFLAGVERVEVITETNRLICCLWARSAEGKSEYSYFAIDLDTNNWSRLAMK